jgi:hypothetical protein
MTQISAIHILLFFVVVFWWSQARWRPWQSKEFSVLQECDIFQVHLQYLGCILQKTDRLFKIDYVKALVESLMCRLLFTSFLCWFLVLQKTFCCYPEAKLVCISRCAHSCLRGHPGDDYSNLNSVPSNCRSASAGTIKTDEWRSLITVYIPIALVNIWGAGTLHPSDEISILLWTILDHTRELVCAVYLVCAWTATPDRAHAYHSHIVCYVTNLMKVHITFALCPNHHAAFHIYNYLLLFGPAHSWWCFPFKYVIGILQQSITSQVGHYKTSVELA